jgi:hypothetical protein
MSLNRRNVAQYKPERDIEVKWEDFSGGWNSIFKPTELKNNELAQADNSMLIGKGTPTGRWGSEIYNLAGESGKIRLLDGYYNSLTSTNYLLTITDQGFFTKRSGASYEIIPGASFASGQSYFFSQLGNSGYINGPSTNYVKFDGTNLIPYVGLSTPTNVSLAQLSAASGFQAYSWLITATSATGETLPAVSKSLASLPLDLTETSIRVSWNQVSIANASTTGYNIYRGFPGDETYIASVGQSATPQYLDLGTAQSNTVFPPTSDTTTGPKARFRLKFDDRIILAGLDGEPSKVLISGRYPYHDRFTAIDGGGYVLVSPNDGDDITGLGIAGNQGMVTGGSALPRSGILVFKNNSVHRVVLDTVTLGNFSILDPQAQLLTGSNGCSSADTIQAVENDTFYFGRKGLYTVGQEPNFLNQIRTNELTARVRNYVQNLSDNDFKMACAGYMDNKYLLSFPALRETIQYDRERGAFMGPWKTPWGITKWFKYQDEGGNEKWLAGSDSGPYIREFSASYLSDSGTAVAKTLRSKKEDMGDWSIFKVLKLFYVLFRNVRGDVTINLRLETRDGNTVTSKSFNITSALGSGGWGADQWGAQPYGNTDATVTLTGDEIVRYAQLYKNCRVLQIEVISTSANTNFEWLGARFTAQGLGDQSLPSSLKV